MRILRWDFCSRFEVFIVEKTVLSVKLRKEEFYDRLLFLDVLFDC